MATAMCGIWWADCNGGRAMSTLISPSTDLQMPANVPSAIANREVLEVMVPAVHVNGPR